MADFDASEAAGWLRVLRSVRTEPVDDQVLREPRPQPAGGSINPPDGPPRVIVGFPDNRRGWDVLYVSYRHAANIGEVWGVLIRRSSVGRWSFWQLLDVGYLLFALDRWTSALHLSANLPVGMPHRFDTWCGGGDFDRAVDIVVWGHRRNNYVLGGAVLDVMLGGSAPAVVDAGPNNYYLKMLGVGMEMRAPSGKVNLLDPVVQDLVSWNKKLLGLPWPPIYWV